jgi:hypothetical protein
MCLEKRAFFRILSGMHSSINIHLSALYRVSGKSTSSPEFGPNLNEFVRRFDTATTNGQEIARIVCLMKLCYLQAIHLTN